MAEVTSPALPTPSQQRNRPMQANPDMIDLNALLDAAIIADFDVGAYAQDDGERVVEWINSRNTCVKAVPTLIAALRARQPAPEDGDECDFCGGTLPEPGSEKGCTERARQPSPVIDTGAQGVGEALRAILDGHGSQPGYLSESAMRLGRAALADHFPDPGNMVATPDTAHLGAQGVGLEPARPLIEAIAAWEREHGTLAAILPDEHADFCRRLARAAITGSARAALATPDTAHLSAGGVTLEIVIDAMNAAASEAGGLLDGKWLSRFVDALNAALASPAAPGSGDYERGLEDAAKIADKAVHAHWGFSLPEAKGRADAAIWIAEEIRALKVQP